MIDPNSRSFGVEIKLPSNKGLRPNMTAILKIADYSKSNTLIIPINAIQRSEAGDYVFIDSNGYAKKKIVKVGSSYGGQSQILAGLSAGDHLVTDGASEVEDGDKIKVLASAGN